MHTLSKFFPTETVNRIIIALVAWQFISVALMAVGTWPANLAILNTVLIGLFILFFKPYHSVLLLILSIPFYIILPLPMLENMPMWRVLFAFLFVVWFIHLLINQRKWLLKLFSFQRLQAVQPVTGARLREIIIHAYQRIDSRLMPWDKVAIIFLVISLFSLLVARFQLHGFKQILFLLNVYIFYVVIVNVVTDADKVKELIRYTLYSLGIMVALGYLQYFATLFSLPYYFWQYWAIMVSSLYYGTPLANVLAYSNSWFSFSGGAQSLRMFGILPDTHAFGVICIFFLAFLVPYLKLTGTSVKSFVKSARDNRWFVVTALIMGTFGIMANGTRGIWLAMLVPLGIALLIFWFTEFLKPFFKVTIAIYCLVLIMFMLSPFISKGMNLIRTYDVDDNFIERASSVYDLNESSNAGRLEIWESSLRFAAVHPFGVGYGNFITSIIPDIPKDIAYEEIASAKNVRYNLPQEFITAHSLYLQLLVELGFAGLLAFGLFWIEYFQKLWQFLRARDFRLNHSSTLLLSIAMGIVWILAYGIFDLTILNDRVLQYLFISLAISGLIFAKYDSLEPSPDEPAR